MDRFTDIIAQLEKAHELTGRLAGMFEKAATQETPISHEDSSAIRLAFNQLYGVNQFLRYKFDDIRNCACCGRPFIIVGGTDGYCDRVRESDGLTCKEYARKRRIQNLPRPRKGELNNGET